MISTLTLEIELEVDDRQKEEVLRILGTHRFASEELLVALMKAVSEITPTNDLQVTQYNAQFNHIHHEGFGRLPGIRIPTNTEIEVRLRGQYNGGVKGSTQQNKRLAPAPKQINHSGKHLKGHKHG